MSNTIQEAANVLLVKKIWLLLQIYSSLWLLKLYTTNNFMSLTIPREDCRKVTVNKLITKWFHFPSHKSNCVLGFDLSSFILLRKWMNPSFKFSLDHIIFLSFNAHCVSQNRSTKQPWTLNRKAINLFVWLVILVALLRSQMSLLSIIEIDMQDNNSPVHFLLLLTEAIWFFFLERLYCCYIKV